MRRPASLLPVLVLLAAACATGGVAPTITAPPASTTSAPPPPTTTTSTTTSSLPTTTSTLAPTTTTTSTITTTTTLADVPRLARSVLMVGLAGWGVDDATARHLAAGGRAIILLHTNIGSRSQVRSLTGEAACAAGGPVLVAVDHELGRVGRLHGLVTPLPSTEEALQMTEVELEITGQLLGDEMLALGINMNLAPILDVVSGPNPALEKRHLGSDPEVVAALGVAFLRGLEQAGVLAVPKHFPGHGRAVADPHFGPSHVTAPLDDLREVDFLPFEAAFAAGARAVMVGHPIYDSLDPATPASLSPAVLNLLRDEFAFDGVALTDALNMLAVAAGRDPGELAVQALAAGEDLLLVVDPAAVEESVTAIVAAVATGRLTLERLQEASARVIALTEAAAPIACGA